MIKEKDIIEKLKTVKDPELGIDVHTLGLIYKVTIDDIKSEFSDKPSVEILMTLTSPLCPFANELIENVEKAVARLPVEDVRVEITFEPKWEPSKELRIMLGV